MNKSVIFALLIGALVFAVFGATLFIACGDDDDDDSRGGIVEPDDDDDDQDPVFNDDDANDDANDDADDDVDDDADDDADDDVNDDINDDADDDEICPNDYECEWEQLDNILEEQDCMENFCGDIFFEIAVNECPEDLNPEGYLELELVALCNCMCQHSCINDCLYDAFDNFSDCTQLRTSMMACIETE